MKKLYDEYHRNDDHHFDDNNEFANLHKLFDPINTQIECLVSARDDVPLVNGVCAYCLWIMLTKYVHLYLEHVYTSAYIIEYNKVDMLYNFDGIIRDLAGEIILYYDCKYYKDAGTKSKLFGGKYVNLDFIYVEVEKVFDCEKYIPIFAKLAQGVPAENTSAILTQTINIYEQEFLARIATANMPAEILSGNNINATTYKKFNRETEIKNIVKLWTMCGYTYKYGNSELHNISNWLKFACPKSHNVYVCITSQSIRVPHCGKCLL